MSNKKSTNNIINPYKKSDMFQINDQPTFNNYTMNNDNVYGNYENISNYTSTYDRHESQDSIYIKMAKSLEMEYNKLNNLPRLFKLFFSKENIYRLQQTIKKEVNIRTQGKFRLKEDQETSDLLICMRAIYLDHGKNLDKNIVRQTKILNKLLIDNIMPDIISNIRQQYDYIRDITQPRQIMINPVNVNGAGRKQLPSFTTLWTK